jgi:hypothetical protein
MHSRWGSYSLARERAYGSGGGEAKLKHLEFVLVVDPIGPEHEPVESTVHSFRYAIRPHFASTLG